MNTLMDVNVRIHQNKILFYPKYRSHPSIKLIKAKNNSQIFKFRQIDF